MRQVGTRTLPQPDARADTVRLRAALEMNDSFAAYGWARSTGQRKGVYRFRSFEAMEAHRIECLADAMAQRA
jgi:hypothetical protein